MSDLSPEIEPSATTPPPTLLASVLARLDARRVAIIMPAATPTAEAANILTDGATLAATSGAPMLLHLRKALAAPHWEVRAAAAHALGALADADDTPGAVALDEVGAALTETLHDDHRLVRAASVRALGRLAALAGQEQQARARLVMQISDALDDVDAEAREAAVYALAACVASGVLLADEARPLLLVAARDVASDVRAAAELALATSPVDVANVAVGTALDGVTPAHADAPGRVGERPSRVAALSTHAAYRRLALWGAMWLRQTRIMRREVWLVMLCGALAAVTLMIAIRLHGGAYDYAAVVAFILSGASAIGVAFLARAEHDPGLELTLATPTSLRLILGGRIALVVGYNCALAVVASVAIGLVVGQSIGAVIQGWVGPLLLVSAIALALSLAVGSATAVCGALLLDITQLLRAAPTPLDGAPAIANALDAMQLALAHVWGAHPATLIFVALCIIAAAILAPQRALKQKEA